MTPRKKDIEAALVEAEETILALRADLQQARTDHTLAASALGAAIAKPRRSPEARAPKIDSSSAILAYCEDRLREDPASLVAAGLVAVRSAAKYLMDCEKRTLRRGN